MLHQIDMDLSFLPSIFKWGYVLPVRNTGLFFFTEARVMHSVYSDFLEEFMYPQVTYLQLHIIYQQDGALPRLEFAHSRNRPENLPGSLDWAQQTSLLDPTLARYHSVGFLLSGGTRRIVCMLPMCLTFQCYETASMMW